MTLHNYSNITLFRVDIKTYLKARDNGLTFFFFNFGIP